MVLLDVAIGLIFVFLIYSLLATSIVEIISNGFRIRARLLAYSVYRMLVGDDSEERKSHASGLGRGFRKLMHLIPNLGFHELYRKSQKKDSLYAQFYRHPTIRGLARNFSQKKPSYLSGEMFVNVLLDLLQKGEGQTPMEKIKFTMDHGLVDDQNPNNQTTSPPVTHYIALDPDIKAQLESIYKRSEGDFNKFKIGLESWFDETQERVSGWYKQKIHRYLFIIGFLIAMFYNVNPITIAEHLSTDSDARDQIVQLASDFVKENDGNVTRDSLGMRTIEIADSILRDDIKNANSVLAIGWGIPDSVYVEKGTKKDEIKVCATRENKARCPKGFSKDSTSIKDSCLCAKTIKIESEKTDTVAGTIKVSKVSRDSIIKRPLIKKSWNYCDCQLKSVMSDFLNEGDNFKDKNWNQLSPADEIEYIFWSTFGTLNNLIAFLIMGLGVSMGAPFWFDLLNKLVKLRGSLPAKNKSKSISGSASDEIPPEQRVG